MEENDGNIQSRKIAASTPEKRDFFLRWNQVDDDTGRPAKNGKIKKSPSPFLSGPRRVEKQKNPTTQTAQNNNDWRNKKMFHDFWIGKNLDGIANPSCQKHNNSIFP